MNSLHLTQFQYDVYATSAHDIEYKTSDHDILLQSWENIHCYKYRLIVHGTELKTV